MPKPTKKIKAVKNEPKSNLPHPVEAIKFRLEQYGHSARKAAMIMQISYPHFTEVLNYKRTLTINQIKALAKYGVPETVLLQDYKLSPITKVKKLKK